MVSIADFRTMALAFPEAIELPHFDLASFRVTTKILTTLLEKNERAFVKLLKSILYKELAYKLISFL